MEPTASGAPEICDGAVAVGEALPPGNADKRGDGAGAGAIGGVRLENGVDAEVGAVVLVSDGTAATWIGRVSGCAEVDQADVAVPPPDATVGGVVVDGAGAATATGFAAAVLGTL